MNTQNTQSRHWTTDEFIDLLYGLQPDDSGQMTHLGECSECGTRWEQMQATRLRVIEEPQIPASVLRNQRLAIEARIEEPAAWRVWLRPVPALAAGLLFIFGLALNQPKPEPQEQTIASVTDTQLFSEIVSVVDETSPRAADPIQALFLQEEAR